MGDGDRPGGHGRDGGGPPPAGGAGASLRVFRGAGVRRPRVTVVPGAVAARLSALERRVEEALIESGLRERPEHETIRAVVDGTFTAIARARRFGLPEIVASIQESVARLGAFDADALRDAVLHTAYRYWWRVQVIGLERVPRCGRAMLVVNRSGALVPWEALMVGVTLGERAVRGDVRLLVDDWSVPRSAVATTLGRLGLQRAGAPAMRRLLGCEDAVVVFPEGRQALAKPYRDRYRLTGFGPGTFARVAIATGAPIVPVAVIGAEDSQPVFGRFDRVGQLLGLPTLPLTATFPWFGAAGLLPLPTKWTIHVGEPLDVAAGHAPAEASRADVVRRVRDQTRERLQALVTEGRRQRQGIFRT